jgi:hypothetical protein
MKDANTGEEIWRSSHWDAVTMFDEEIQGEVDVVFLVELFQFSCFVRTDI